MAEFVSNDVVRIFRDTETLSGVITLRSGDSG